MYLNSNIHIDYGRTALFSVIRDCSTIAGLENFRITVKLWSVWRLECDLYIFVPQVMHEYNVRFTSSESIYSSVTDSFKI